MDKPQDEMDYLVKHRQYFLDQPGFPGWSGMGQPGEMERTSGFWVSKAGARFFPNGFRYDPRADAHWEWGAVLAGGLELCSGEETRRVAEGECYFMPPGRALVARPLGRPFLVWFELAGERCSKFARVCNYPLSGLSVGTLSASPLECAVHIAQALHDRPVGFSLFAQAQLWNFMAHTGNPLPAERSGRRSEIQQVLDYLNQCDLREDLPLSRLAQLSGLSVETFRKRFFEAMGDSPVHYLLKRRLTAAKEMLSSTDMSVMQVGEAVGFSDPYYFSRVFRKYQGLSPSAFRLNFFSERFKV